MINSKAKNNRIWLSIVTAIILTCALVFSVMQAFGLFVRDNIKEYLPSPITPMGMTVSAWFEQGTSVAGVVDTYDSTTDTLITDPKFVTVNLTDPAALEYFAKLRVNVTYSGTMESLMRVHVTHLWRDSVSGNIPSRASVKYTTSNMFIDNSSADSCYYFCDSVKYADPTVTDKFDAYVLKTANNTTPYNVITGINQDIRYDSTLELSLIIQGELIQANRMEAFWGFLPLPPLPPTP